MLRSISIGSAFGGGLAVKLDWISAIFIFVSALAGGVRLEKLYSRLFRRGNQAAHPHFIIVIKAGVDKNVVQNAQRLAILQVR